MSRLGVEIQKRFQNLYGSSVLCLPRSMLYVAIETHLLPSSASGHNLEKKGIQTSLQNLLSFH